MFNDKKVASGMKPGSHGTTFGGNPLAMSVGNAVLDVIFKKGFLKNVEKISRYFHKELQKLKQNILKLLKKLEAWVCWLVLNFSRSNKIYKKIIR